MPAIIDRAKGSGGLFDLRKAQFNAEVRPVVKQKTGTNPVGEPIYEKVPGDPLSALVRFETGQERVENGRLQQDQAGVVQVDYTAAQDASLGASSTLEHENEKLFVHSTRDLHQAGEILELSVTRAGEAVGEEV